MSDDFKKLDKKFDKRFDELMSVLSGFANDVDKRFDSVEGRLFKIEKRLDAHDEEFRKLNAKYDHLVNTIDSFIAKKTDVSMAL